MQFLKLIAEAKADGQVKPLTRAIREAVRHNVLKDYLERKGGEVLSILMTEYDYATDIAVKQEEAYAIGRNEGILVGLERGIEKGIERGIEQGAHQKALETAQNFLSMGFSPEQVAQGTNLPLDVIRSLMKSSDT